MSNTQINQTKIGQSRTAWAGFLQAARQLATRGEFAALGTGRPATELNQLFDKK